MKEHFIRSCRYLLLPVVRLLLQHGVTWDEFGELSKEAYVSVARDAYGIDGRPTNNARVAMLTGLSRREVARVRDQLLGGDDTPVEHHGNPISRILSGWHVDGEFSDDKGQPKVLPTTGPTGSLTSLLKRYAGDLPHGAIRKEMQKRGLIEELADGQVQVLRRDYVYSELDPDIIRRMSVALHDHGATLQHNLDEDRAAAPYFEAIADNARITPRAFSMFQQLVEAEGLAFLEVIDKWLSQHETDIGDDTDSKATRMGVGVYLIYNESDEGQDQ